VNLSAVAASTTPWQPCVNVADEVHLLAFASYHAWDARLTPSGVAPVAVLSSDGSTPERRLAAWQNARFMTPDE